MQVENTLISDLALEILEQLFMGGPTHDGDLISKAGRDELSRLGVVERSMGYNTLNAIGVCFAVERRIHFRKRRASIAVMLASDTSISEENQELSALSLA